MRVALLAACPYPVPQGSQVYLRESAYALQAAGAEVHLVVYGYGVGDYTDPFPLHRSPNPFSATKTAAGPSWHKPWLDLALAQTLRRVVRRERIDVVVAHNCEALIVALTARVRPVVYHPHNAMADELPHYTRWTRAAARFGRFLDCTFPKRANAVVAPHAPLARYLESCGCRASATCVVAPPMRPINRSSAREMVDAPAILYTGNLDAYQNLDVLKSAVDLVSEREPKTDFRIVTSGIATIPWARVETVRGADDLYRLLAQDVIVVCPRVSWSGYPIKLLNAMNAGAPIVCAEGSAHPFEHNVNGIVVPDNDAAALADALVTLMRDPASRQRLGEAARLSLIRDHDPEVIGYDLLKCYYSVL